MNCYQFERIITHYIDNDLKQTDRHQFNDHKEQCNVCSEKLRNIEKTILTMNKIPKHVTSSQFNNNLQEKIIITTTTASTWKKIFEFSFIQFT